MSIFNSLGSNYNLSYVLRSLFGKSGTRDTERLKKLLEQKYGGKSVLFYKGREALSAVLKILDLPKDAAVAINGFTCVAVFNAIRFAGYTPACLDLEKDSNLNFSSGTLEKAHSTNNIKVVVVQNTLGYLCDIEKIQRICKKNKLILIEDLAHCIGAIYSNGKEAGTVGDFVILSFSQDKVIDAVSGGALIIRNKKYQTHSIDFEFKKPDNQLKDRFYPYFTYKIRHLYSFGFGKPYNFLLKKINLMSNIMDKAFYDYYSLPSRNAMLALFMFKKLDEQLTHRKKITNVYAGTLAKEFLSDSIIQTIEQSTNLRFPIFVENRNTLIKYLADHKIFLSDIWYQDVAPECPIAVAVSKAILNLPTHINVSEKDAKRICRLINQWKQKS